MTMDATRRSFRFRPRYRGLAIVSIALGVVLAALGGAAMDGSVRAAALVLGGLGTLLGVLYLVSPAWRIVVHVDDGGIEVTARGDRRFLLAWGDVKEVVASPTTRTCFVDGGEPARSLLVPGDGAPAPYDIEGKAELYAAIVAAVPAERVRQVELLESA